MGNTFPKESKETWKEQKKNRHLKPTVSLTSWDARCEYQGDAKCRQFGNLTMHTSIECLVAR